MAEPPNSDRASSDRRNPDQVRPDQVRSDQVRSDRTAQGRAEQELAGLGAAALEQLFGARADRLALFDARARIITAVLFAISVVSLQSLSLAVLAFGGACLVAWVGGVSARRLRHLLPLELLMLVLVLTLPFSVPGEPVAQFGSLAASVEGLALALLILFKANAVVLSLFGLVGAMGPAPTVHALTRLGLPSKLCHLLFLTLRQIDLVADEYRRLLLAMRARAFVPRADRQSWRALGWLIGMLLVRSLARGQRVADAMRCRGFDGRLRLLQRFDWQRRDTLMLLSAASLFAALVLVDQRGWIE